MGDHDIQKQRRASQRVVLLALLLIAFATRAQAGSAWVGAELHLPVPARDIGDSQLGADAGLTLTAMTNRFVGVGVDVAYHYWPASSAYRDGFNRYLRTTRMESLVGSDWALSALQTTAHLKFVVPVSNRCEPWVQVGAGFYRVNFNLDERRPPGTFGWVEGVTNTTVDLGGYGGVGLDVRVSPRVTLGVGTKYHYVISGKKSEFGYGGINDLQDVTAITAGLHVQVRFKQ